MNRLLVFGAGGHGRVVGDAARLLGRWSTIEYADDRAAQLARAAALPLVGSFAEALAGRPGFAAALGVGRNARRLELARELRERGIALPAIIHPSAIVAEDAVIGDGAVILARAVVQPGVRIGMASIVNTAAVIEHDCVLGDGAHVSPGACLGGEVQLGACAWIGIGAAVIQCLRIGAHAVVGAGAAVVAEVPDGVTVGGVPARLLKGE